LNEETGKTMFHPEEELIEILKKAQIDYSSIDQDANKLMNIYEQQPAQLPNVAPASSMVAGITDLALSSATIAMQYTTYKEPIYIQAVPTEKSPAIFRRSGLGEEKTYCAVDPETEKKLKDIWHEDTPLAKMLTTHTYASSFAPVLAQIIAANFLMSHSETRYKYNYLNFYKLFIKALVFSEEQLTALMQFLVDNTPFIALDGGLPQEVDCWLQNYIQQVVPQTMYQTISKKIFTCLNSALLSKTKLKATNFMFTVPAYTPLLKNEALSSSVLKDIKEHGYAICLRIRVKEIKDSAECAAFIRQLTAKATLDEVIIDLKDFNLSKPDATENLGFKAAMINQILIALSSSPTTPLNLRVTCAFPDWLIKLGAFKAVTAPLILRCDNVDNDLNNLIRDNIGDANLPPIIGLDLSAPFNKHNAEKNFSEWLDIWETEPNTPIIILKMEQDFHRNLTLDKLAQFERLLQSGNIILYSRMASAAKKGQITKLRNVTDPDKKEGCRKWADLIETHAWSQAPSTDEIMQQWQRVQTAKQAPPAAEASPMEIAGPSKKTSGKRPYGFFPAAQPAENTPSPAKSRKKSAFFPAVVSRSSRKGKEPYDPNKDDAPSPPRSKELDK
jgi:hypothetical protein